MGMGVIFERRRQSCGGSRSRGAMSSSTICGGARGFGLFVKGTGRGLYWVSKVIGRRVYNTG